MGRCGFDRLIGIRQILAGKAKEVMTEMRRILYAMILAASALLAVAGTVGAGGSTPCCG